MWEPHVNPKPFVPCSIMDQVSISKQIVAAAQRHFAKPGGSGRDEAVTQQSAGSFSPSVVANSYEACWHFGSKQIDGPT